VHGGREDESLLAGLSFSIPLYMRNDFHAEVGAANAKLVQAERTAHNAYQLARARLLTATARLRLILHTWPDGIILAGKACGSSLTCCNGYGRPAN